MRLMPGRTKIITMAVSLIGTALFAISAADADRKAGPVVVELFTSQSCYSCPPAEAYLGELAGNPDIVALEWHVDYWDDLVYGSAGRWKDPYSDPAFTERQGLYNRTIRRTGSVYTPQMVIDGAIEAVGSRRQTVRAAIENASSFHKPATVSVFPDGADRLSVQIDGTPSGPTAVWLVQFIQSSTTDVPRGENHGKQLVNHNIVRELRKLATWSGGPVALSIDAPEPGFGCAILVQREPGQPIEGAQSCGPFQGS